MYSNIDIINNFNFDVTPTVKDEKSIIPFSIAI